MKIMMIHDHDCRLVEDHGQVVPRADELGGIAIYLERVIAGLQARGHGVSMVRYRSDGAATEHWAPGYYELASGSQRLRRGAVEELQRIVEQEAPDVVHLHSVYFALHPRVVDAVRAMAPTVQTLHDVTALCLRNTKLRRDGAICQRPVGWNCVTSGCFRLGEGAGVARDLVRVVNASRHLAAYRRLPLTLVPSGYLRDELVRNGFARRRVHVAPLFSRFEPAMAATSPGAPVQVLYVGRLAPEKGILALLTALVQITAVEWRATVVGDGPALADAQAFVARHRLQARVTFAGAATTAQLPPFYRSADVVVVPSLIPESFNLVGVEALAFGRPVVAFRSGGITEWLEHNVNGLLTPHGDVAALAENLRLLIVQGTLREELGSVGRAMVQARFTLEAHLAALLACYGALSPCGQEVLA